MNKRLFYSSSVLSFVTTKSAFFTPALRRRITPTMSSSLYSTGTTDYEVDGEINKWDQMYNEGGERSNKEEETIFLDNKQSSGVGVITFDLDNTIWKTKEVIEHANLMLAEYLTSKGIVQTQRTEKIMGELFYADPTRYNPLAVIPTDEDDEKDGAKKPQTKSAPVFLSQLRTDAIKNICMEESNGYNEANATSFAQSAFTIWFDARHEAIPNHYVNNALSVLNNLRSNPNIVIGAITDGNSEPRNVKELSPIFDFVINAEGVGVSKPHRDIYHAAIQLVSKLPQVKDRFPSSSSGNLEVGPWWVHVGDDFIKDIVACKQFNMRSVWSKELIHKNKQTSSPQVPKTERDIRAFMEKISKTEVVEMQIGADDYLADSITSEFVDASIDTFEDLIDLIESWQSKSSSSDTNTITIANDFDEAIQVRKLDGAAANNVNNNPSIQKDANNDEWNIDVSSSKNELVTNPENSKFCIFCGTNVPIVAKFCHSCGKNQPEMPI